MMADTGQTIRTLGQLCAALWDSQTWLVVIQPGIEPGSVVTPLALRCSALDPCAIWEIRICRCSLYDPFNVNVPSKYEATWLLNQSSSLLDERCQSFLPPDMTSECF